MNESCRRGYYFDLLTTFSGSLVLLFSRNLFMEEKNQSDDILVGDGEN